MRYLLIIIGFFIIFSCSTKKELELFEVHYTGQIENNTYTSTGFITKDSVQYGKWVIFKNGNSTSINNYEDGKINGEQIGFYPNGRRSSISTYKNGKRHGMSYTYDYEGELVDEVYFEDGEYIEEKSKEYKYWFADGTEGVTYVGDSAGNYIWKNGQKIIVSELTDEQIRKNEEAEW